MASRREKILLLTLDVCVSVAVYNTAVAAKVRESVRFKEAVSATT